MTQVDDGGWVVGDPRTDDSKGEGQGARRPEHGGQTASLPTKGKNPRPTEDDRKGKPKKAPKG